MESWQHASPSAAPGWQIVFDTLAVDRAKVTPGQFTPPAGFQERPSHVPPLFESATSIPAHTSNTSNTSTTGARGANARASEQMSNVSRATDSPPLAGDGLVPGSFPALAHPGIVPVFWGSGFTSHLPLAYDLVRALGQLLSPRYEGALAQYGVSGGSISSNPYFIAGDPPASNGAPLQTWDPNAQFQLENLMLTFCLQTPALCGGQDGDGVIALFVPASLVTLPAYHDYVFHYQYFSNDFNIMRLLQWQLGYVAVPAYMVVPVGDNALNWPNVPSAWQQRANPSCDTLPGWCEALADFDMATSEAGHEFAEATTDPYVDRGLGWRDPSILGTGETEAADICGATGDPLYANTDVNELVVARYWSNLDNECMPSLSSLPTIRITVPRDHSTVAAPPGGGCCIMLQAVTSDPIDGASSQVVWYPQPSSDSNRGHTSYYNLPPGTYTVFAGFTDPLCTGNLSCALIASTRITFTVVAAGGPSIKITQPADGASLDSPTTFTVNAQDGSGNPLPDSAISWTDELLAGTTVTSSTPMGTGNSIKYTVPVATCGQETHRITATATVGSQSASDNITVYTGAPC
jgi:hypothetical protein